MSNLLKQLVAIAAISLSLACSRSPEPAVSQVPDATAKPAPGNAAPARAAADTAAAPSQPVSGGTVPSSATTPAAAAVPAQLPAVVARVNGDPISRQELEGAIASVEARSGQGIPADQRAAVTRQLLDQIVEFHVLVAEARARKLEISDGDLDARVSQMKQGFPNEEAFQRALAEQHVALDDLRQQTRMGMQVDKLVDAEITSKIAVQEGEVGAYYRQNLERFKLEESVHASHILIAAPGDATAAQKAEARARAEEVLREVRGGADFARLARERSGDPGSAQVGGDLGFFPKNQMEPAFAAAAFRLKPGAPSELVETPFGFHILKVHERRGPRTAALAEVSQDIRQFLTEQQRDAQLKQFIARAKVKTKIEILF